MEIETLGSGQTEKCHDKDLRAAGVLEGFISSARASLFASKAALPLRRATREHRRLAHVLRLSHSR